VRSVIKIGILTSSRADYGVYLPLLQKLKFDPTFDLQIIAFGTHLSENHGYTLKDIEKDEYTTIHKISSLIDDDSQKGITISYGNTVLRFSDFWNKHPFDIVLCLGDRFEMSAAVQATIPFGIKLAHIHGGETTLGAIDNIYRHQITLASKIHFTSTKAHGFRVAEIIKSNKNIYNVGALSLSDIKKFKPINRKEFFLKFNISDAPYCLITFHPETNAFKENKKYANEMRKTLELASTKINLVITMPNADNMGKVYREQLFLLKKTLRNKVSLIENFGKENYFSAMFYADFLLGNTSSGIVEAGSFKKYVVNVGDRQKGRAQSNNIIDSKFKSSEMIRAFKLCLKLGAFEGKNIYYKEGVAEAVIKVIKQHEKL